MTAPLLETERLRLRGHQASDLAPMLAMWQQPPFCRYLGGQPLPENEVWTRLLRSTGLWPLCGFGYWAVEEKATGEFIGAVGFADFRRAISPALGDWPEAGWVLAPHCHGRGYASEAVGAALAWGDKNFPRPRTVCLIDVANEPSLRLANKLGYKEYARTELGSTPVVLLERFAPG
ncbi:GNAT family N-acetyltransferase [Hymenobacter ginsengisoli]|uniref:GNAT family N-acetyltransferase n=1 Tax=Hymenobacter ginsengisoli TaxID=1051626 RepID=A0ABP8QJR7_9BACT|nr:MULTISPECIES: GNAT family N-acetyltransferase [unclassified Hymenobacter]MBO2031345.1 GNAT family N-acetyltransferase [Hymenobacter sp. BT559]